VERTAARAVVRRDGELLMLRSRHGDYKFPGGGVDPDEPISAALARELREECGLDDATVGDLLFTTIELSQAREPGAVFKMTSLYFDCMTSAAIGGQDLDDYERDLLLTPSWVTATEALRVNQGIQRNRRHHPDLPWLLREIRILKLLDNHQ